MIWFTADLHLGHESLATQKRGFSSLEAMEHTIIQNINIKVAPTDTLYILGDFSCRCTVEHAHALRKKIVCRKVHLISGNHDKDWSRPEVAHTFVLEAPLMRMKTEEGQMIVLCHYPLLSWGRHAPRLDHAPWTHPFGAGRDGTWLIQHPHAPGRNPALRRRCRCERYGANIARRDPCLVPEKRS